MQGLTTPHLIFVTFNLHTGRASRLRVSWHRAGGKTSLREKPVGVQFEGGGHDARKMLFYASDQVRINYRIFCVVFYELSVLRLFGIISLAWKPNFQSSTRKRPHGADSELNAQSTQACSLMLNEFS